MAAQATQDSELIRQVMRLKTTGELQTICHACDFDQWTPQAIEIAREALQERGTKVDQRVVERAPDVRPVVLPSRAAGFGLAIAAFLLGLLAMGGHVQDLVFSSGLLIVVGIPLGILLALSDGGFLRFVDACVTALFTPPAAPDPRVAGLARTGKWCFLGAGVLGTVVGIIQMMKNLSNVDHVGLGMACALCSVFNGVVGALLLLAVEHTHGAGKPK